LTGALQILTFQNQNSPLWNINLATGALKTNSSQLVFSGTCPTDIVPTIRVLIDSVDSNAVVNCLANSFSTTISSGLTDNWAAPGNGGFGYKIDFVPYDDLNAIVAGVPIVTYYLLIKSQVPGPLTFTDISYFQNNSLASNTINNNDTVTVLPDLNSGGSGNLCLPTQAEIRVNGNFSPGSADLPLMINPVTPSSHSGTSFQYWLCMSANEIVNLQITQNDTFGNPPSAPLSLALHFQTNGSLDTIIPSNLASSFITKALAPDFGTLSSGAYTLDHIFSGVTEANPELISTGETGYTLDFDFNHYLIKVTQ
jgi:hypothetical protein